MGHSHTLRDMGHTHALLMTSHVRKKKGTWDIINVTDAPTGEPSFAPTTLPPTALPQPVTPAPSYYIHKIPYAP